MLGQPPRSSPTVAAQLRLLHAQYLQPLQDLFYKRLYHNRQAQAQALAHNTQQPSIQQPQPISAVPGMSAQLLDIVAKTPASSSTEQQRRVTEDIRRQPQASHEAAAPILQQVTHTPTASTSANVSNKKGMSPACEGQVEALKANRKQIYQFIKGREEGLRDDLRKHEVSHQSQI